MSELISYPRYRCFKEVRALVIKRVMTMITTEHNVTFEFVDGFDPITTRYDVISRYTPKLGDYLVIYDDGYMSVSPKAVFEAGYARIGDDPSLPMVSLNSALDDLRAVGAPIKDIEP